MSLDLRSPYLEEVRQSKLRYCCESDIRMSVTNLRGFGATFGGTFLIAVAGAGAGSSEAARSCGRSGAGRSLATFLERRNPRERVRKLRSVLGRRSCHQPTTSAGEMAIAKCQVSMKGNQGFSSFNKSTKSG